MLFPLQNPAQWVFIPHWWNFKFYVTGYTILSWCLPVSKTQNSQLFELKEYTFISIKILHSKGFYV